MLLLNVLILLDMDGFKQNPCVFDTVTVFSQLGVRSYTLVDSFMLLSQFKTKEWNANIARIIFCENKKMKF